MGRSKAWDGTGDQGVQEVNRELWILQVKTFLLFTLSPLAENADITVKHIRELAPTHPDLIVKRSANYVIVSLRKGREHCKLVIPGVEEKRQRYTSVMASNRVNLIKLIEAMLFLFMESDAVKITLDAAIDFVGF